MASRRIRSASSRSTSGPMWVLPSVGPTTSPSCSSTAGRCVPRPGTSQAKNHGIDARSVRNVATSDGHDERVGVGGIAVAERPQDPEASAIGLRAAGPSCRRCRDRRTASARWPPSLRQPRAGQACRRYAQRGPSSQPVRQGRAGRAAQVDGVQVVQRSSHQRSPASQLADQRVGRWRGSRRRLPCEYATEAGALVDVVLVLHGARCRPGTPAGRARGPSSRCRSRCGGRAPGCSRTSRRRTDRVAASECHTAYGSPGRCRPSAPSPTHAVAPVVRVAAGRGRPVVAGSEAERRPLGHVEHERVVGVLDDVHRDGEPRPALPHLPPDDDVARRPAHEGQPP